MISNEHYKTFHQVIPQCPSELNLLPEACLNLEKSIMWNDNPCYVSPPPPILPCSASVNSCFRIFKEVEIEIVIEIKSNLCIIISLNGMEICKDICSNTMINYKVQEMGLSFIQRLLAHQWTAIARIPRSLVYFLHTMFIQKENKFLFYK